MSEFLAEAKVLIKPDTSRFRTELNTAIRAAVRDVPPVKVPINVGTANIKAGAARSISGLTDSLKRQAGAQDVLRDATKKTRAEFVGLGSSTAKLDAALLGVRTAIGSSAVIGLGAGALAAIAFGKAIRAIIGATVDFETQLNVFQATTGATADEMERVSESAKRLGADITLPAVSAGDAAGAMTELAKAGLSVQDAIDGARGVLQLGTAANISFADAVQLAASALNAFQLAGRDSTRVADVLANSANSAQGSISDIGLSLQQAAAVGRQAGLSFEDTTLFLTLLAKSGLRGSDAGTSLRTALIRLIKPTDEAAEKIRELGIEIRDQAGNIRPDVFIQFAEATKSMSPAARDATLALIGGQDALRAFAILGRTSIKDFIELRQELRKQGTASDVAAARTKGLGGSFQALSSTLQTVGITIGQKVSPGLTDFINNVTASISAIGESDQVAQTLNSSLSLVGASLTTVGTAATTVAPLLAVTASAFQQMVSAVGVEALLAGFLAFNFGARAVAGLNIALAAGTGIVGRFTASLVGMSTGAITARTALSSLQLSATRFIGSFAGAATLLAVAAAGFVYLATRETEGERVTRKFAEATQALSDALTNARASSQALASVQSGRRTNELAVAQAKLAVGQAQAARDASTAAKGSLERKQVELQLAIALDNVSAAQQRYEESVQAVNEAQDEAAQASATATDARRAEIVSLQAVIAEEKRRAQLVFEAAEDSSGPRIAALIAEAASIGKITDELRERASAAREQNTQESRDLARRLELLATFVEETKKLPTEQQFKLIFEPGPLIDAVRKIAPAFGLEGEAAAQAFLEGLKSGPLNDIPAIVIAQQKLAREQGVHGWLDMGTQFADAHVNALKARLAERAPEVRDVLLKALGSPGRSAGLEEQADILTAQGAGPQQELGNLERQLAEKQRQVDKINALDPSKIFGEVLATRRRLNSEIASLTTQIGSVESEIASGVEEAAGEIATARNKADEAILKMLSADEQKRANILAIKQGTEGARDDLVALKAIRAGFKRAIEVARQRIKDLETFLDFKKATNQKIFEVGQEIKKTEKELAEQLARQQEEQRAARQEQRQQNRERLRESLSLDVQIAETTGNKGKEIRARQAEIDRIRVEIRQTRAGSNQRKQLILELRQKQKELAELRKEKEKTDKSSNAFNELAFDFLQKQQGFAANLLGNLIPGFAAGGLVGGTQPSPPPGADLGPLAGAKAARDQGVTPGSFSQLIGIQKAMLDVMERIAAGNAHPETKYQRVSSGASMDFQGGV